MAQVYSFVDENGVTRLFAEIHPDPAGTPFNGGTITAPLTIDDTAGSLSDVLLSVLGVHTTITMDGDGTWIFASDDGAGFRVSGTGGTEANILATNAAGAASIVASATGFSHSNASGTQAAGLGAGLGLVTSPVASAASGLALGTAYQFGNADVLLLVCLNVTVNTSGVLKLGVGPTTTPTQTNIISGVTTTGQWNIPIYLPANYYALLSVTGTITVAIDGQIAMSV